MTSFATRRRVALPILCFLAGACTAPKADQRGTARDPNTPAVVQAPQVVLASDTAKKDTSPGPVIGMDGAKRVIAGNFAVLGAAIAFGERVETYPSSALAAPYSTSVVYSADVERQAN